MPSPDSQMRREVREIPQSVATLIDRGAANIAAVAAEIRALDPRFAITVARGSSDHICGYLKYATEILLGLPVASIGPSVASIYAAPLKLERSLCLSVSQSGRSPDIVEMARAAARDGALTVAITNDASAPLAKSSAHTLDIHAGPEHSVAATKTFVTSAVAGLLLLAEWRGDAVLRGAIRGLPEVLERAVAADWSEIAESAAAADSLFVLGRGPVWAMSNEAALKFKETSQIHAESYSSAEVLHGPVSILREGFPVLCFVARDAAAPSVVAAADELAAKGAHVFVTSPEARRARPLASVATAHPLTDPISLITSFYAMVESVARRRGLDPDAPPHLRKVTETV